MKIVFEYGGPNPFTGATTKSLITLEQHDGGRKLFRVTYGLEVKRNQSYSEACKSLGGAILHHLNNEGLLDSEGD